MEYRKLFQLTNPQRVVLESDRDPNNRYVASTFVIGEQDYIRLLSYDKWKAGHQAKSSMLFCYPSDVEEVGLL